MPRCKKRSGTKGGGGGGGARYGVESVCSEDDCASEARSHCSSASEVTNATEDVGGETTDEHANQEDVEDKLKDFIESTLDKSVKIRLAALEGLRSALSRKNLYDFLTERRVTLTDSLERCLKKGKGEEQALAAVVATLLVVQLGANSEGEECFRTLQPVLTSILVNASASAHSRQSCATALAMCCYISDGMEELVATMKCLEAVFSAAYPSAGSPAPAPSPALQALRCAALLGWALLLTICPASRDIIASHLPKLPALLSSDNVNMRIAAGEAIALLFELAHEADADFQYVGVEELCDKLKDLATDGNKSRAKTDRRKQRAIFRDVLKAVEEGEAPSETIRFGPECIYVDSWLRKRTYDAFKDALGSGVRLHLQENELLRDIFELGPPLLLDPSMLKTTKISRFERHMFNSATFKARTKARSKMRDKRADVV
ncbi:interferon-related developmental regulator 1-like [Lampetra fluviatilis]